MSVHSCIIKMLTITSEMYLLLVISKQVNIKIFNENSKNGNSGNPDVRCFLK